ncbi:hypothetical protein BESB_012750 [Besnoitia besnoiti]|uniref:Aminoacyl-transfer RNA synthetases class-II family profile domain-containing protein n=1 Tax=Besnoitia besnoiti TaxID=94643 RepID=A0A2A9MAE5_BESBE|nr:hypothetical protein BESB_012750 [Besnoitia besnoiti]PFH32663.1 hypothetical protein BESB_012750 [Besnoitia besnoiti]
MQHSSSVFCAPRSAVVSRHLDPHRKANRNLASGEASTRRTEALRATSSALLTSDSVPISSAAFSLLPHVGSRRRQRRFASDRLPSLAPFSRLLSSRHALPSHARSPFAAEAEAIYPPFQGFGLKGERGSAAGPLVTRPVSRERAHTAGKENEAEEDRNSGRGDRRGTERQLEKSRVHGGAVDAGRQRTSVLPETGEDPLLPRLDNFGFFTGPVPASQRLSLSMQDLKTFCRDHAIVVPAAELYGGLKGVVDFGAVGHLLVQNIRRALSAFFLRDACAECEPVCPSGDVESENWRGRGAGEQASLDQAALPLLLPRSPPRLTLALDLPRFQQTRHSVIGRRRAETAKSFRAARAEEEDASGDRLAGTAGEDATVADEAPPAAPQDSVTERADAQQRASAGSGATGEGVFAYLQSEAKPSPRLPQLGPIFFVETACLGPAAVWEGSGHARHFVDLVVSCRDSGRLFRVDALAYRQKGNAEAYEVSLLDESPLGRKLKQGDAQRESKAREASERSRGDRADREGAETGERVHAGEASSQSRLPSSVHSSWRPLTEAPREIFRHLPSPVTGRVGALSTPFHRNLMLQTRLARFPSCQDSDTHNGEASAGGSECVEGEAETSQKTESPSTKRGKGASRKQTHTSSWTEDEESIGVFRPETAQGLFVSYRKLLPPFLAPSLPFGTAQEGRAWRNELISSSRFLFRLREFRQFEIEYFFDASKTEGLDVLNSWLHELSRFFAAIGLPADLLSAAEQGEKDRAHYSSRSVDVSFRFPFGVAELCGLALRGDYDLRAHQTHSGQSLALPAESGSSSAGASVASSPCRGGSLPHVVEPSLGLERLILALLSSSFARDVVNGKPRTFLNLHPGLAPFQAAVFPVVTNVIELTEQARRLRSQLRARGFSVLWDFSSASIGRRYRRADELGVPFCFTLDHRSLKDGTVTVRWRNSAEQRRLKWGDAERFLKERVQLRFQDFVPVPPLSQKEDHAVNSDEHAEPKHNIR